MKQNTEAWHAWRDKGLGSSDAATIMGVSPYSNLRLLYLDKTNRSKNDQDHWGTRRGKELEDTARTYFEVHLDMADYPPRDFEHHQYPFLRCSLDGWNAKDETILEIKCPGKEEHEATRDHQTVPEKYFWQIQHQLMVTGAKRAIFASYHPEFYPKGAKVWLAPDTEAIKRLAQRAIFIWDLLQQDIDPSLSDPNRLSCDCADKVYFGDRKEALGNVSGAFEHPFKCHLCGYYHLGLRRMNKRSKNILDSLQSTM
jgi:putative phage-type endonuclease